MNHKPLTDRLGLLRERVLELENNPDKYIKSRKITATNTAGGIYFVYEKIRNAVDYRELNLIRKASIERFLRRKINFKKNVATGLGENLIIELIKTRYLPNGQIPEEVAHKCDLTINKFQSLFKGTLRVSPKSRGEDLEHEIIGMLACELDQIISPRDLDNVFVDFVFEDFKERSDLINHNMENMTEISVSLYSAIHRLLLKSDINTIRYYLFINTFPKWIDLNPNEAEGLAEEYGTFQLIVEPNIRGKGAIQAQKIVKRNIAPYIILKRILGKPEEIAETFENPNRLETAIRKECGLYYNHSKSTLFSSIIRSIIFIFLTKSVIALVVELPYNTIVAQTENHIPVIINLLFPPIYLLLLGITIEVPGEKNEERIIVRIKEIMYVSANEQPRYNFKPQKTPSKWLSPAFNALYASTFGISFSLLIWILLILDFNVVDMIIFVIFISTVSFFGLRISSTAKELYIGEDKRGFVLSIFDFFYTPFMKMGQWLSDTYSRVNIFTFILDFFIEAPLKSILGIFEEWTAFMKEKREDLI